MKWHDYDVMHVEALPVCKWFCQLL